MPKFPLSCVVLILSATLPLGGCVSRPVAATHALSPIGWNGQDRVELPLTINSYGSLTVPVHIKGRHVVAILDTGSSVPVLSPFLAAGIDMAVSDQGMARDAVAVEYGPVSQELDGIFVTDIAENQEFIAGQELFSRVVVELDFDRDLVTLIRPGAFVPPTDKPVAVQFSGHLPTVQIRVNGHDKSVCAIVDTGFYGSVALSPKTVDKLALPIIPGSKAPSYGVGGKVSEATALEPLKELRVGDQLYRNVQDASMDDRFGVGPNACSALLGMKILSRHRIIFDLGNHRMWLLPRPEIKNSR